MIELRLQFFAAEGPGGEKTEEPTSKKLEDTRKEGQVAKSRELSNAAGLLAMFLILQFGIGFVGNRFLGMFHLIYNRIPQYTRYREGFVPVGDFVNTIRDVMIQTLIMLAPFLIIGFLVAFLSNYVQFSWKVTSKPLQPKFNKMNPISGFKKIFSVNSLVELLKSIFKILIVGGVAYSTLKEQFNVIYLLFQMPLWQGIATAADIAINMGLKCTYVYTILALLDFAYQKRKFMKDQRMTKQEVKDEYKQAEGDPAIKGKIRQRMQEASRRRMMQQLPQADVVITNPTHFAVAIQYDKDVAEAPLVIAKGQDYMAQKIKEVARENRIEIVENKPLARMLYHNVEVGEMIPPELYQAVAEILAMVYHMQGKI
ncbi:MAG: flagellar biosynthesis protein FlhB [Lachnospiraceae bacterium]|jgi:flagellar biosynthetic protein FlhB|nr:flagellar biosynthesis protein FlhB [Lachnospiraceae bacterium]